MVVEYAYALMHAVEFYLRARARARRIRSAREEAKAEEEAARNRYAKWSCPDCRQTFGPRVRYVNYDRDHVVTTERGPFVQHVIVTCNHCGLINVYDPTGVNRYEAGQLVAERRLPSEAEF
jgi:hypothetical protein